MNLFITGVTGFLGSHFLLGRLGRPGVSVVLARGETALAARQRVVGALALAAAVDSTAIDAESIGSRVRAERGDVTRQDCGVSSMRLRQLREQGIDEFWHFAASLAFSERQRAEIVAQNVGGAMNALDLAHQLGARRFVYVSTAYTAGRRRGLVPETLYPTEAAFNNVYEETKCRAERAVAYRAAAHGIDHRIVRPAIVVGSSRTWQPGGSETGLYGFVRMLHGLRPALMAGGRPIRLAGDPATPLHLVPVDRVVQDLLDLADLGFPGGPVYHLTPRRSIDAATALEIVCREVGTPRIRVEPPSGGERTALERVVDGEMSFYGGYLRDPKIFERARPADYEVTAADLRELTREYLRGLRTETDWPDPPYSGAWRTWARIADGRATARL